MVHSEMKFNWVKPLKRSEKSKVHRYIEKRRKESNNFKKLQGTEWKLSWEQIKEMF